MTTLIEKLEAKSHSEAKRLGLSTYNTGLPCKSGHIANRKASNGNCLECDKIKRRTKQGKIITLNQNIGYKSNPKNRHKILAHYAIKNAIRNGELQKQPCSVCDKSPAQAHHDDYSKLMDITWLCPKHHRARHKELEAMGVQL